MKYGVYRTMNYQYARQGIPEGLMGIIDSENLWSFIRTLEETKEYIGQFTIERNVGHFRQRTGRPHWNQALAQKAGMKEFHIFPYEGPEEFSLDEWKALI